jgi:hypothetical protein
MNAPKDAMHKTETNPSIRSMECSRLRAACAAVFAGLVMLASARAAAPMVTIGTLAPEGTSYHRSLLEMREKWAKAPGGGVRLRIYAGGKLGGDAKMVSQMRLGALDAGMLTTAGLTEIEPAVAGLQGVPMMYRSLAELDYVTDKLTDLLEQLVLAQAAGTLPGKLLELSLPGRRRVVPPDELALLLPFLQVRPGAQFQHRSCAPV